MAISWVAVVIYPVGMWLGCLALLWKASTAVVSGSPTPFSRSISFLHREYKATAYWWELMEMLRKFLLIGLLVPFEPGRILQIAVGTVISAAYLVRERCWNPTVPLPHTHCASLAWTDGSGAGFSVCQPL
jgi:hypothetical protein